ncbi:ABC transporter permease [Thermosulfurimonas dismutans]|uniref:Transport permease protein n=1 Tax=Thermosulfurimonas dismutans TaxID=999894 RepID=A0A179D445_9BACT|nr:ABC transporter permease [Thermosulfurimonas dismutans]OAQ20252.1 ABC-type multidrug transport system, permease component [Thermosulfurimonas dismutans]
MRGFLAVYLRELLIIWHRLPRMLLSFSVSPTLYLVAFGFGLGKDLTVEGRPYLEFLVPGVVAAASMMQGFGINVEINVARFYLRIFEEFQAAPISNWAYVLGEILGGVTRALLSTLVILAITALAGVKLHLGPAFFLGVFLNAFVFASLGVASAMLIRSHADQALVTNFIITPMVFLGGTFFPVEGLPAWARLPLKLLPLTHASHLIRNAAYGNPVPLTSLYILLIIAGLGFFLAYHSVDRARD